VPSSGRRCVRLPPRWARLTTRPPRRWHLAMPRRRTLRRLRARSRDEERRASTHRRLFARRAPRGSRRTIRDALDPRSRASVTPRGVFAPARCRWRAFLGLAPAYRLLQHERLVSTVLTSCRSSPRGQGPTAPIPRLPAADLLRNRWRASEPCASQLRSKPLDAAAKRTETHRPRGDERRTRALAAAFPSSPPYECAPMSRAARAKERTPNASTWPAVPAPPGLSPA